jgi:hypothetical protein
MSDATKRMAMLLGMLGSDHDGEVITAARKAHALLVANDWTWPSLLGGADANLTQDQMNKIFAAGMQKGEAVGYQKGMIDAAVVTGAPAKSASITVSNDLPWIESLLAAAAKAEAKGLLNAFEIDFADSMRARIKRFGDQTYVTQKQFEVLRRLETALRRRGYL